MNYLGHEIHGWCSEAKRNYLQGWIDDLEPAAIVEIGVYGGASLIPMAHTAMKYGGKVVGIDPWSVEAALEGMVEEKNKEWWEKHSHLSPIKRSCEEVIQKLGLKNVELWVGTSDFYVNSFRDDEIGVLSIDGNHGPQAVKDAQNYYKKVKSGGLIAMDDTEWAEGGVFYVRHAIDWLTEQGCQKLTVIDGCTMLQKPAI